MCVCVRQCAVTQSGAQWRECSASNTSGRGELLVTLVTATARIGARRTASPPSEAECVHARKPSLERRTLECIAVVQRRTGKTKNLWRSRRRWAQAAAMEIFECVDCFQSRPRVRVRQPRTPSGKYFLLHVD